MFAVNRKHKDNEKNVAHLTFEIRIIGALLVWRGMLDIAKHKRIISSIGVGRLFIGNRVVD
jgi:hypothetical protein